jgi:hypothetical protein
MLGTVIPPTSVFMASLVVGFAPLGSAHPQESASASRPTKPVTIEDLRLRSENVPHGWKLDDAIRCVSIQARDFIEDPTQTGLLPVPKQELHQTVIDAEGVGGTFLILDYGQAMPEETEELLPALLWGGDSRPTATHPEEIHRHDGILLILSFPAGCAAGEWVREHLAAALGRPLPRSW